MPYPTDYTNVLSDPGIDIAIDSNTPIEGNGELSFKSPNAGPQACNIYRTAALERGYVRGVLRGFIRPNGQSNTCCLGWAFLQNQLDVSTANGGGQCYFAFLKGEFGSGNQTVSVAKVADGIAAANLKFATKLLNANVSVADGNFMPIEVEYNANPALSGVELSLWHGTVGQSDFTGLTLVGTIIDTTSPLMTSVAEGPACYFNAAQVTAFDMDVLGFDQLVED